MSSRNVIEEQIVPGMKRVWDVELDIYSGKTKFQQVDIVKTCQGATLFCDYERQSSEATQLLYHEGMTWPAIYWNMVPKNTLVLGSSEGVAPQIFREYWPHGSVVHVDIDQECVTLCAQYLPYGYNLDDLVELEARNLLIYEDGKKYLEANYGSWDIICMDLPDSFGETSICAEMYSDDFLKLIKSRLSGQGVFITQAGSFLHGQNQKVKELYPRMRKIFPIVEYFCQPEQGWCWLVGLSNMSFSKNCPSSAKPQTISWGAMASHTTPPSFLR